MLRRLPTLILACLWSQIFALAQTKPFVGVLGGVATLSSDARTLPTSMGLSASSYEPENGPVLNLVAGIHWNQYLTVQANYVWNRNTLTLSSATSGSSSFYEERRKSTQQAALGELLVYFRGLDDRLRPYLSVGAGVVHFSSTRQKEILLGGTPVLPPAHFDSTRPALRVAVGMDVTLTHRVALRYSFAETIRHNDVSAQLAPPASRNLANFQNLFGLIVRF